MPAVYNKETGLYDWETPHKSWMKCPIGLTENEAAYLTMIETIFTVEGAGGNRVNYIMAPHQVWYHLHDYTVTKGKCYNKVVKKSRNTSFTVSSIISMIMSMIEINNPIVPLVRLNASRAIALVNEFKDILKGMVPIEDAEGNLIPFNINDCNMKAAQSITMPNNNQFLAFPANSDSSESIRGIRTHFGFIDESNFMRKFKELVVALRKASYGTDEKGEEHLQMHIGTTLKGETPFSEWLEVLEKNSTVSKDNKYIAYSDNFVIFDWPIFDRVVFEKYYNGEPHNEIPFHENDELVSLVPWQTKEMLWTDYKQDHIIFLEENMAVKVDSDEQFYGMMLIMSCLDDKLALELEEINDKLHDKYVEVVVGVDVASVHDYFVFSCFGKDIYDKWHQFHLKYETKVDINTMESYGNVLFDILDRIKMPWRAGVDANGIGLHITQNWQRRFGDDKIRGIKGGMFKDSDGNSHKLNEFGHTKLKRMMNDNKIFLQEDELLIKHFASWNYEYKCQSTEHGHGDITMACLYAVIQDEYKFVGDSNLKVAGTKQDNNNAWYMREFKKRINRRRL